MPRSRQVGVKKSKLAEEMPNDPSPPNNPYQLELDLTQAFEEHVKHMQQKPETGWSDFFAWTMDLRVRHWVIVNARVDPLTIIGASREYTMAPYYVAYHRSIEVLSYTPYQRPNALISQAGIIIPSADS